MTWKPKLIIYFILHSSCGINVYHPVHRRRCIPVFSNFTLALFILFFKAKGKGCRNKKDIHYIILRPSPDAATSSTPPFTSQTSNSSLTRTFIAIYLTKNFFPLRITRPLALLLTRCPAILYASPLFSG